MQLHSVVAWLAESTWPIMWPNMLSATEQARYKQIMNTDTTCDRYKLSHKEVLGWGNIQALIKPTPNCDQKKWKESLTHSSRHAWHLIFLFFIPMGGGVSHSWCSCCKLNYLYAVGSVGLAHHIPFISASSNSYCGMWHRKRGKNRREVWSDKRVCMYEA